MPSRCGCEIETDVEVDVDAVSMESFPASDPPSWWAGGGTSTASHRGEEPADRSGDEPAEQRGKRTMFEFDGANCGWCLSRTLAHLRADERVRWAALQAGSSCIEVHHTASDAGDLLTGVGALLRGWRQADNGERVIVDLDVHPSSSCPAANRPCPVTAVPGQPFPQ